MVEIEVELKDESEKAEVKETISDLFSDASFPGKDGSNTLLIRANPDTIGTLKKLAKIKIVGA